jgi:hypothetical protein
MKIINGLLGTVAVMLISGCVVMPAPHSRQVIPEVNGFVTMNHAPVKGAKIYFYKSIDKDQCIDSTFVSKTNENGKFYFKGNKDFRLFLVFGDPAESWGFCIKYQGRYYKGWSAHGIGYSPNLIDVNCELSNLEDPDEKVIHPDGSGICQVSKHD